MMNVGVQKLEVHRFVAAELLSELRSRSCSCGHSSFLPYGKWPLPRLHIAAPSSEILFQEAVAVGVYVCVAARIINKALWLHVGNPTTIS